MPAVTDITVPDGNHIFSFLLAEKDVLQVKVEDAVVLKVYAKVKERYIDGIKEDASTEAPPPAEEALKDVPQFLFIVTVTPLPALAELVNDCIYRLSEKNV